MKKLLLTLCFLIITSTANAQLTATITDVKLTNNILNIKVDWSTPDFTLPSDQSPDHIRIDIENIPNKTQQAIRDRALFLMNKRARAIIIEAYRRARGKTPAREAQEDKNVEVFNSLNIQNIIGRSVSLDSTTINIDKDQDGVEDTQVTINTDLTKSESPLP